MDRNEFEALRDLKGKRITDDVVFKECRGHANNLIFKKIIIHNSLGIPVELNGEYKPSHSAFSLTFIEKGKGPICRFDVNSNTHGNVGRTHKHSLTHPKDQMAKQNLPHATARIDLEGLSTSEIWAIMCEQANILHEGTFYAPDED